MECVARCAEPPTSGAPLTRDLDAFTGRYASPLYGALAVVRDGTKLEVAVGPHAYPGHLAHWSGDTFLLLFDDPDDAPGLLTFDFDGSAAAAREINGSKVPGTHMTDYGRFVRPQRGVGAPPPWRPCDLGEKLQRVGRGATATNTALCFLPRGRSRRVRMRGQAVVAMSVDSMESLARPLVGIDMDHRQRQIFEMVQQLMPTSAAISWPSATVRSDGTVMFTSACSLWPSQRARTSVTS